MPLNAVIDTLRIDTDLRQVHLTWRTVVPSSDAIAVLEARFEADPAAPLIKFKEA